MKQFAQGNTGFQINCLVTDFIRFFHYATEQSNCKPLWRYPQWQSSANNAFFKRYQEIPWIIINAFALNEIMTGQGWQFLYLSNQKLQNLQNKVIIKAYTKPSLITFPRVDFLLQKFFPNSKEAIIKKLISSYVKNSVCCKYLKLCTKHRFIEGLEQRGYYQVIREKNRNF